MRADPQSRESVSRPAAQAEIQKKSIESGSESLRDRTLAQCQVTKVERLAQGSAQAAQLQGFSDMAVVSPRVRQLQTLRTMAAGRSSGIFQRVSAGAAAPQHELPYAKGYGRDIKAFHSKSSQPVQAQFNLRESKWADGKAKTTTVKKKLAAIEQAIHDDECIFAVSELDDFYEKSLRGKTHSELENPQEWLTQFKKYVAGIRDAQGAHGVANHGGSGDSFIVDRVNQQDGPKKASYLLMDDYLRWDSVLIANGDDIYKAYLEACREIEGNLQALVQTPLVDADAANYLAGSIEKPASKRILVNYGNQKWVLTLQAYVRGDAFEDVALTSGSRRIVSLRVGASVVGNNMVSSRSVSKGGQQSVGIHDVVAGMKCPEAHTGGLAPKFLVDEHGSFVGEEPVKGKDSLVWVTKY